MSVVGVRVNANVVQGGGYVTSAVYRSGPMSDPCGTPYITERLADINLSRVMRWLVGIGLLDRPGRNDSIHCSATPPKPNDI